MLYSSLAEARDTLNTEHLLQSLISQINDGHAEVWGSKITEKQYAPFVIEHIENKPTITDVLADSLSEMRGLQIVSIDGKPVSDYITEQKRFVSGANSRQIRRKVFNRLLAGSASDTVTLILQRPDNTTLDYKLTYGLTGGEYNRMINQGQPNISHYEIEPNIHYLNASTIYLDSFIKKYDLLQQAQAIIIDGRRKPHNSFREIVKYFISQKDTIQWMSVPIITKPDYLPPLNYKYYGWELETTEKPITAKVYYLIGQGTFSYGESVTAYFDNRPNTLLVGMSTSGTNGNVNSFQLPGGYIIRYTGMRVVKHNGANLHGIGFAPDVEVFPTIRGITDGRDEVLEKAIELAKMNQ